MFTLKARKAAHEAESKAEMLAAKAETLGEAEFSGEGIDLELVRLLEQGMWRCYERVTFDVGTGRARSMSRLEALDCAHR